MLETFPQETPAPFNEHDLCSEEPAFKYVLLCSGHEDRWSVIQSDAISIVPKSMYVSSMVININGSKMNSSKLDIRGHVEKPGTPDNMGNHQFPHFLEENSVWLVS